VRAALLSADGFLFDAPRYTQGKKENQDFGEAGNTWVWLHAGKTVHYLSGSVGKQVNPGDYEWMIQVSTQVCDPMSCLPGNVTLRIPAKVVPQAIASNSVNEELFTAFAKAKSPKDKEDR